MAPKRSTRSLKRQTRLEFQPLQSSSPVKSLYSDAVQHRLAGVKIERKGLSKAEARQNKTKLTLESTSPIQESTRLNESSSPLSSLRSSPLLPPRFAESGAGNLNSANTFNTSQAFHLDEDEHENEEEEDVDGDGDDDIVPPSSKRRRLFRAVRILKSGSRDSSSSSDEKPFSTPMRRSTRLGYHDTVSTGERMTRSLPSRAEKAKLSKHIPLDLGSSESSDENVMATMPSQIRRLGNQRSPKYQVHSAVSSSMRREDNRGKPADFVVDDDDVDYISSEHSSLSDTETPRLPGSVQRRTSNKKKSRRRARREREELADDLLDLRTSDQENEITEHRTRGGPVQTERDKAREHFARLKRRRAGERLPRVIDSDEGSNGIGGVDIDEAVQHVNISRTPSKSPSIVSQQSEYVYANIEDEDNAFIVEDSIIGARLGRPNSDIPLQFTSFASAKPRELFLHLVEWMVKNKISPAFNRYDDVYRLSASRIEDQVKAQAGSRLISSAWNAVFKNTILARPEMRVSLLEGFDEDLIRTCDACNRINHPARYEFTFMGKAYSKESLESLDDSDDDGDVDTTQADEKVSYDEHGHVLASTTTSFYLGRFCAANAEMGHKLTHWKFHLNEQVLAYLEEQGVLSADSIVHREKLSRKRREKEAENVVDTMQETGMIADLWSSFQHDLDDARIGMEGHESRPGKKNPRIGTVRKQSGTVTSKKGRDGVHQARFQFDSNSEGE